MVMCIRVAEVSPLPFAHHGEAWPALDAVLARALHKNPSERFASVTDFARALGEIVAPTVPTPATVNEPSPLHRSAAEALVQETLDRVTPDGCCGLAGSAYGILSLYRETHDRTWLRRAEGLANRAFAATRRSAMPTSLYKGTLGVAVLAADLLAAEGSSMPLFEAEGWPSRA